MLTIQVNNQLSTLEMFAPETTLLEYLREHLALTGTKEGCASGDCGACTVIVEDAQGTCKTINACITPLGAMQASRVHTVEGVTPEDGTLHPIQQAMVDHHASQCGFCTPGFVMSLINHSLQPEASAERDAIVTAIGGNLCRCTGYKPIIDAGIAACAVAPGQLPGTDAFIDNDARDTAEMQTPVTATPAGSYHRPRTVEALAQIYATHPEARLVGGATDLWLEVTQQDAELGHVVDLAEIKALRHIETSGDDLMIGAAVTHAALQRHFEPHHCAAIDELLDRFGSPQVRNRGTIGGNLGNASPIADWPPLLLALDATLVVQSAAGIREVALLNFYKGYRQTDLAAGEFIRQIRIPGPVDWQSLHFHKISKRIEDDISSVAGAFRFTVTDGIIEAARVAYGGMAATPLRMTSLELQLEGETRDSLDLASISGWLRANLAPISDVRASAEYRLAMAENMLRTSVTAALEGSNT